MSSNRVESARPREEHLRAVLDVLSTALATEEPGVAWNDYSLQALQALGCLSASVVLLELEGMLSGIAATDPAAVVREAADRARSRSRNR